MGSGARIVTGLLITAVATATLQILIYRPRAEGAWPSFPDMGAALTCALWMLRPGTLRGRPPWIWAAGAVAPAAAGWLLLRPPLADMLAGVVWGLSWGLASRQGLDGDEALTARLKHLIWPQIALGVVVTWAAWAGVLRLSVLQWAGADKLLHFLIIGGLAFWLTLWWPHHAIEGPMGVRLPISVLVPLAVAGLEEGLQALSPVRTADWLDLACDVAGLIVFRVFALWIFRVSRAA